jgi:hypothetical protein
MPILFIDCPTTGKPVSTGKTVPRSMPANHMIGNIVNCNECQRLHKWKGKEAYYFDAEGNKIYLK